MTLKTPHLRLSQCEVDILLAYYEKTPPDPKKLFRIENPVFPEEKLYAFGRLHELGLLQGGMPPKGKSGVIRADRAALTGAGYAVLKSVLGITRRLPATNKGG